MKSFREYLAESCLMESNKGDIIIKQLGGNKFTTMTGAKDFIWDEKKQYLQFALPRNSSGANRVKIYLRNDLYDIELIKYTMGRLNTKTFEYSEDKVKVLKTAKQIFAENLPEVFEKLTGLYVHL